jgi:hypothetical protein
VNVKVPDGVQAGDAVPVTITVGNLQSQPGVTMAVAQWRPELIWCGWRGEDRRHEVRTTWLTPHAPAPVPLPRRSTGPPATPWPIVRDRRRADGPIRRREPVQDRVLRRPPVRRLLRAAMRLRRPVAVASKSFPRLACCTQEESAALSFSGFQTVVVSRDCDS